MKANGIIIKVTHCVNDLQAPRPILILQQPASCVIEAEANPIRLIVKLVLAELDNQRLSQSEHKDRGAANYFRPSTGELQAPRVE